jgi:hypothetical protein
MDMESEVPSTKTIVGLCKVNSYSEFGTMQIGLETPKARQHSRISGDISQE